MIHCNSFRSGLIGHKLGHSFSPQIHSLLADYEYKLYELEENEVGSFLKMGEFDAINVTIPYKKTVMPYLDFISDTAKKIGSVNTIVNKDGKLYGYNTDYYGFSYMVKESGIGIKDKKVLVLGTGGASLTVKAVLKDMGAKEIVSISRTGEHNYTNLYLHYDADVIVNTTPVGMYPENGVSPVSLSDFTALSGVLDLIYNPSVTRLLYDAKRAGIPHINGLTMLAAQAKRAAELFLDTAIDDGEIPLIVRNIELSLKNIVLIGMPGCGKTTAGKLLAKRLSRQFTDTDEMIEEAEKVTIPEIFSSRGEEYFRQKEHIAAVNAGKTSGRIIATGGGIVTRGENYYPLHQNSYIIWLRRDTALLPIEGRPISQANNMETLYKKRKPLYEKFADAEVQVSENPEETVNRIIDTLRRL